MPVQLYGQVADMDAFMEIARSATACGSSKMRRRPSARPMRAASAHAVSVTSAACRSFPTKNLGAFGDAGMCVTNDAGLAERLDILRVHGGKPKYYHAFIGGNFRLDEMQAAVLNVKLRHLDAWSAARQRNAAFYDARVQTGRVSATPSRRPGRCRGVPPHL